MATLVVLTLFYNNLEHNKLHEARILYQVTDIFLLFIGSLAVSIALYQIRVLKLKQLSEEDAFDDNLLLVGLLGMLLYDMFLLVPSGEMTSKVDKMASLFVGKAVLEIIQALLQVIRVRT